jgi:hypothetical protein
MASGRVRSGRMVVSRRATIDFPAPGGPSSRRLWTERLHPLHLVHLPLAYSTGGCPAHQQIVLADHVCAMAASSDAPSPGRTDGCRPAPLEPCPHRRQWMSGSPLGHVLIFLDGFHSPVYAGLTFLVLTVNHCHPRGTSSAEDSPMLLISHTRPFIGVVTPSRPALSRFLVRPNSSLASRRFPAGRGFAAHPDLPPWHTAEPRSPRPIVRDTPVQDVRTGTGDLRESHGCRSERSCRGSHPWVADDRGRGGCTAGTPCTGPRPFPSSGR